MWIFMSESLLSIVAHKTRPNHLLVRARGLHDIAEVFPNAEVEHTPSADYPYRAVLPRKVVARRIAAELEDIQYPNFKDSVRQPYRAMIYAAIHAYLQNRVTKLWRKPTGKPCNP
jgi:hypothetical protein